MRAGLFIAATIAMFATSPGFAAGLSCRAKDGGPLFSVATVTEVPAAAVKMAGSEHCDVVYHLDGSRYELGGCDRQDVGLWSPREGSPLGQRHGRLRLVCQ